MRVPERLPTPRSWIANVVVFGVLPALAGALFGYWFAVKLEAGLVTRISMAVIDGLLLGVVCGLVATAGRQPEQITVALGDATTFAERVVAAARAIGYRAGPRSQRILVFRPGWSAGIFSDVLGVEIRDQDALVAGPRDFVRRLAQQLEAADTNDLRAEA